MEHKGGKGGKQAHDETERQCELPVGHMLLPPVVEPAEERVSVVIRRVHPKSNCQHILWFGLFSDDLHLAVGP